MEIAHPPENRLHEPLDERIRKLEATTRAPLDTMPAGSFTSSNVHSALYDFGARELYLRFLRDVEADAIYRYDDVDARTWQALVAAPSKGSYVNSSIAYDYRYTKVNASDLPEDGRALSEPRVRRFVTQP